MIRRIEISEHYIKLKIYGMLARYRQYDNSPLKQGGPFSTSKVYISWSPALLLK